MVMNFVVIQKIANKKVYYFSIGQKPKKNPNIRHRVTQ